MTSATDTPRTDGQNVSAGYYGFVKADFARALERELSAAQAERDDANTEIRELKKVNARYYDELEQLKKQRGGVLIERDIARVRAEHAEAERDALDDALSKANGWLKHHTDTIALRTAERDAAFDRAADRDADTVSSNAIQYPAPAAPVATSLPDYPKVTTLYDDPEDPEEELDFVLQSDYDRLRQSAEALEEKLREERKLRQFFKDQMAVMRDKAIASDEELRAAERDAGRLDWLLINSEYPPFAGFFYANEPDYLVKARAAIDKYLPSAAAIKDSAK